jgi:hypothetical protein
MNILSGQRRIGVFNFDFLHDDDHGDNCRTIKVTDGTGWEKVSPNFGPSDRIFRFHCCWALLVARSRLKEMHDELYEKYKGFVTEDGGSEQGASLAFNYTPGERGAHP